MERDAQGVGGAGDRNADSLVGVGRPRVVALGVNARVRQRVRELTGIDA